MRIGLGSGLEACLVSRDYAVTLRSNRIKIRRMTDNKKIDTCLWFGLFVFNVATTSTNKNS